jgi:hypothetical protein
VTGDLTVTSSVNIGLQLYFGSVQGSYDNPLILSASGTNSITGTCGFIRLPYATASNGVALFQAAMVLENGSKNSMVILTPTGQNQNRGVSTWSLIQATGQSTYAGDNQLPAGKVYTWRVSGIVSTGADPTGFFAEARYLIVQC